MRFDRLQDFIADIFTLLPKVFKPVPMAAKVRSGSVGQGCPDGVPGGVPQVSGSGASLGRVSLNPWYCEVTGTNESNG